jgi:nicotinate-nucleotide adenylyltransferase
VSNIAIYGGSFDPPHLGHIMVVTHLLLNDPSVDQVLVVPCFEQRGKKLTDFDHRMTMCSRAFSWLPRVKISPVEKTLGGESLTVRLIEHLASTHSDAKFRFVMGADLLKSAPTWEGWDTIARLAPPLCIGRAGISPLAPGDPTPISPIVSSSIVRKALGERDYASAGRFLPVSVCQYIEQNKLYVTPEGSP